jgi:hypothetical protein
MQFVCASMKLRQIFYTQIELRTFHTVWTRDGHLPSTLTTARLAALQVRDSIPIEPNQSCR